MRCQAKILGLLMPVMMAYSLTQACSHRDQARYPGNRQSEVERSRVSRATQAKGRSKHADAKEEPVRYPRRTVETPGMHVDLLDSMDAPQPGADNSRVNQWQNGRIGLSAEEQSNSPPDLSITRRIRRALIGNDHLSPYAKNIKIIARQGHVTLKGPVRSDDEKKFIEQTASSLVGENSVRSEIVITPE